MKAKQLFKKKNGNLEGVSKCDQVATIHVKKLFQFFQKTFQKFLTFYNQLYWISKEV